VILVGSFSVFIEPYIYLDSNKGASVMTLSELLSKLDENLDVEVYDSGAQLVSVYDGRNGIDSSLLDYEVEYISVNHSRTVLIYIDYDSELDDSPSDIF
jgi:hypothetical protein